MFRNTKSLFSIGALTLAVAACGGASTPSTNTPASSGTGARNATNVADGSTPAGQASSSSTSEVAAPESQTEPTAGPEGRGTPPASAATEPAAPGSDVSTLASATSTQLTDAQIAKITDDVNSAEIEQARLAKERTKNPEVRRFASMMIDHHGEARTKQAAMNLELAESPLSRQLAEESKNALEALKTKRGEEFDRAYLDAQVTGHQKVLDTLDRVLAPQARSPELERYLTELEPKVSQHLEAARTALESVQSSSGKTSSR